MTGKMSCCLKDLAILCCWRSRRNAIANKTEGLVCVFYILLRIPIINRKKSFILLNFLELFEWCPESRCISTQFVLFFISFFEELCLKELNKWRILFLLSFWGFFCSCLSLLLEVFLFVCEKLKEKSVLAISLEHSLRKIFRLAVLIHSIVKNH